MIRAGGWLRRARTANKLDRENGQRGATQTSRLISNYAKFKARNVEVVLVFPLVRQTDAPYVQRFAASVQGQEKSTYNCPFPIVMDVELHAVDLLGIRDDLSKPATYIIDPQGRVRYAYVGESMTDRPSVQALLEQLDQIQS